MRVGQCSGMPADTRPADDGLAAGEAQRQASGTFTVMEPVPSDTDCVARSLSRAECVRVIFERHFRSVLGISIDVPDVISLRARGGDVRARIRAARASTVPGNGVLPWLYGIATNVLRRSWRAERRRLSVRSQQRRPMGRL